MSPTNESIPNFWQMIWDQNVQLIVMLCPIYSTKGCENEDESVAYWDTTNHQKDQRIVVTKVQVVSEPENLITRRLISIRNQSDSSGEERTITHLQVVIWVDDQGVTDEPEKLVAVDSLVNETLA